MAAEPRRQSVVRVVTVDFFYRRAPAYSAELKPGNLARGHLAVLMTTHEARRLATQNTASGNDLRCKAIHDT